MQQKTRVWVVGLSDIGRSPRLQNHAASFADQGNFTVDVIGQKGSEPLPALLAHEDVNLHYVPTVPAWLHRLPTCVGLPLKAVLQAALLLFMLLFTIPKPRLIFLQVPPAIPTLFLVGIVSRLRRAKLIIDWHNFAYTLMAISMGSQNPLVRLAKAHEKLWARQGHAHLCVTRAMQQVLASDWGVNALVFYDRPPSSFRKASLEEKHQLLLGLRGELEAPMHPRDCCTADSAATPPQLEVSVAESQSDGKQEQEALLDVLDTLWTRGSPVKSSPKKRSPVKSPQNKESPQAVRGSASPSRVPQDPVETTLCTVRWGRDVQLRADRPALLISSTSWTPDEDFGILLRAAQLYDAQASSSEGQELPRLLILVTGKGPQKAMYQQLMRRSDLQRVAFRTLWLHPADYPRLLGCADLGISLHTSSSGLDLPMKVVDMFGCGLPVAGAAYPCLSELLQDGKTGLHFSTAEQLAAGLADLFQGFPRQSRVLREMETAVLEQGVGFSWDAEWARIVLPLVREQLAQQ